MSLATGTHVGHYEIIAVLGAGGMGEVYRARDIRLGRDVALKFLPGAVASDSERLARFDREARTLAALNHPNIVTIHSVEESDGTRFLTMEVVDGRPLDRVIPPEGLPLSAVVKYGIAMAEAVVAAHARHIVHRDLKPANVMVTSDDRVKVLDFGIAKLIDPLAIHDGRATTVTAAATIAGQIVGTAAYMSPEQAEGRAVDHRSDVFALGVLLYEMTTGVRPFRGDTPLAVLSAIVRDDPAPMTELRPEASRELERVVAQCLVKDPEKRLPSAAALRDQLLELASVPFARRPGIGRLAAAVMLIGIGLAYWLTGSPWRTGDTMWPAPAFTRVTDDLGAESSPSLSPVARELVYAVRPATGTPGLYLRDLQSGTVVQLTNEATDDMPAFSPDGRHIAFRSSREASLGIFLMDRHGQSVRRVVNGGSDPSWTPDGREIVYSTESGGDPDVRQAPSELWAVNIESGVRRRIAPADAVQPRVSPDGTLVAFWALGVDASGRGFADASRTIWVQPLAGGERVRITSPESTSWNPAWSPDGRTIYFASDRGGTMNFWRVAVDSKTGRPSGDAVAMTAPAVYAGNMSVDANGTIAYGAVDNSTFVRSIAFDPQSGTVSGSPRDIVTGQRAWLHPDVSKDGRFLALRSFKAQEDVWVVGVDGTGLRRVTNDAARDRGPRWAPDGSLVYYSARNGLFHLWSIRPDGSGARQLTQGDMMLNDPVPSRDGAWIGASNPNSGDQFIFDSRNWNKLPERLPSPPSKNPVYLRDWSPDGSRIAAADTSAVLWVYDVAAKTWERVGPGAWPRWLPDGRRLVATSRSRIMLIDTTTKAAREIYADPGRLIGASALDPAGRQLYFTSFVSQSDIWTIQFDQARPR